MNPKPIRPELRFLLDAERARPDASNAAKSAARDKLAALLGPAAGLGGGGGAGAHGGADGAHDGPGAGHEGARNAAPQATGAVAKAAPGAVTTAASPAGIATAKLVSALLLSGVVGAGIAIAARPVERVVYVDRPIATAIVTSFLSATDGAPGMPFGTPTSDGASTLPLAVASGTGATAESASGARAASSDRALGHTTSVADARGAHAHDTDLSAERTLIDRARSALARGDAASALSAIAQHERSFPGGQLAEEREALAVQALVTSDRVKEAAERGARFRKRFPDSVLLPLVDQALR